MKSKSVATLAGTIAAAILASSCCIGPLILAGLGIGSIGAFSSLEKYRLLFMIITFAFIGMAFYFTYRKKRGADACCETKTNRIKRAILWVIAAVAVGLLLFPYLYGTFSKSTSVAQMSDDLEKVVLAVEGMSCEACAKSISFALLKIQGVKAVNVSFENKEAVVGFDNGIRDIPVNQLLTVINSIGYKSSVASE